MIGATQHRSAGRTTRACIAIVLLVSILPAAARAEQAPPLATVASPNEVRAARLDRSGARLVVAGAVTLGIGVLLQVAGGLMFGIGANENDASHGGVAVEATGIPVLAVGAGATVAGATMLGIGASRKHRARTLRAELSALPSLTPVLALDRRSFAGGLASWSVRF